MVARMLEAGGVEFGDHAELAGPNEDNPLGFWEHEGFRGINEELLRRAGGDWRNPPVLGKDALLNPSNADLQERSRELLASLDGLGPSFGWKDPRTSLVLPFWLHLWTGPMRAICCLRHPAAVAASLAKRNRIPAGLASYLWQKYLAATHQGLRGQDTLVVSYGAILANPKEQAERMADYLNHGGLNPDAEAMAAAVEPELAHHQAAADSFEAWWPGGEEMYRSLEGLAHDRGDWRSLETIPPPHEPFFVSLMAHASELASALDFRENAYGDRVRESEEARQQAQVHAEVAEERRLQVLAVRERLAILEQELEGIRSLNDNLLRRLEVRLGASVRRLLRPNRNEPRS